MSNGKWANNKRRTCGRPSLGGDVQGYAHFQAYEVLRKTMAHHLRGTNARTGAPNSAQGHLCVAVDLRDGQRGETSHGSEWKRHVPALASWSRGRRRREMADQISALHRSCGLSLFCMSAVEYMGNGGRGKAGGCMHQKCKWFWVTAPRASNTGLCKQMAASRGPTVQTLGGWDN